MLNPSNQYIPRVRVFTLVRISIVPCHHEVGDSRIFTQESLTKLFLQVDFISNQPEVCSRLHWDLVVSQQAKKVGQVGILL